VRHLLQRILPKVGKGGTGEFQRFLNIACGSASELEYHFLLARDLAFLNDVDYEMLNDRVVEVKRMVASLARKVEEDRPRELKEQSALSKSVALRGLCLKLTAEC
jgi:hypothetical protein